MTLVVGERHGDGSITVVADSQLTYQDQHRSNPYFDGALKLLLPRRSLCVGIAGIYNSDHIQRLFDLGTQPFDAFVESLCEINGTDFVVACIDSGTRLVVVKDQQISEPRNGRVWAGDAKAFDAFQASYHQNGAETAFEPSQRILASMQAVLSFGNFDGVHGFHLRAVSSPTGFQYAADGSVAGPEQMTGRLGRTVDGWTIHLTPIGEPDSFSVFCCPGYGTTYGACGYFIAELDLGLLWRHHTPGPPLRIRATSIEAFVDQARSEHRQLLGYASVDSSDTSDTM